ncbi:hypothetical protein PHYSODRAFT_250698 [Phytophthora sojae]|uniref:Apple domain-containing protein n=1 Tax=Phytophthora sojae (strain P6497) TaxID=1094619 RepID=G4ZY47_PHYSP|nr:hypothetical protein PHYSODRAFT_250698 [Phytophthora sojae]EGZ11953.1 hypothetical protein PHYSODRAFT_250698 [Phytophthora sojae]|eukprot:XP_009532286.1 hypothetical protein PHYSODRAFT_250698 [Phytophthora sojae]
MPPASEYTYASEQLSTQAAPAKKLLSQETMDMQTAISELTKAKEHEDLGKIQDNDIANVGASNTGACCSICPTWPGWNAFTRANYNGGTGCRSFSRSNLNGGTCWLKSAKGQTDLAAVVAG